MGNVTFPIGGRDFMLACADGEEAHVKDLAALIHEKVLAAGAQGQTEGRMLLFAALMMADELHDLRTRAAPADDAGAVATRLEKIARSVESLAQRLETDAAKA
ncbi:cell division protein ZapA [Novosphingobium sp. Leaf2]|uniref:cell division protein ZapA n=1 Tax=Novosphingobium sp. Leaf2 TaxID=1735670 RepID=UPI0006FCE0DF|nr:cell division protein ZapA [Novosphingobium sp. Leaf2]KQM13076.1 cell division protein ZapA [Novosphingobium sp. Leaf2]